MMRLLPGLISLCLMLLGSGCATSQPVPHPVVLTPTVPSYLLKPLPAPSRQVNHNRDLLQLLADYEQQRRRFNADRVTVMELLSQPGSTGEP